MDAMAKAAERRERRGKKLRRDWLRSQMDCGQGDCGECRVCRRLDFLEWVGMVAPRDIPHTVSSAPFVDEYIRTRYQR